tara:strand:+ start:292 stop:501 length:210 start_codon:yes stop_codon:yes gene_type:complete
MSKKQTIKFTIKQDGTVIEEVKGVKGTQCLDLTESIENQLGDVTSRKATPEQFQVVPIDLEQNVTFHKD